MLASTKRRMSILERSIQIPLTVERAMAQVQERVRLTGASCEDAFQSLIRSLSVEDLDRLAEEFTELGFGDETEATEATVAD
jgi:hypothetical protein